MRDVVGYENIYGVTSCGRVWSYKSQKFLKPRVNNNGYLFVDLYKDGKRKKYYIHKLVSQAFLPNPNNLTEVDHIDNDKMHNYLNNLQWITHKDNVRKSCNKPILQYDLDGNLIREWPSATDVGSEVRLNIVQCLRGKNKTAYGFIWKYKNDINTSN